MSIIADVLVYAQVGDEAAIVALNSWLARFYEPASVPGLSLLAPGSAFGGGRAASYLAWGGAFDHLDHHGFLDAAARAPWRFPDYVTPVIVVRTDLRDYPVIWTAAHGMVADGRGQQW